MEHPYQDKLILMVEDNPSVLRLNQKVLETNGFQVKAASTLADAETILETDTVNLILLDILCPTGRVWISAKLFVNIPARRF